MSAVALLRDATARLTEAGIPTARIDAEMLLASTLGTSRLALYTAGAGPIPPASRTAFQHLLERRLGHEPLQYLLGRTEFRSLSLVVGPGVFIPRPETEELVERALALPLPETAAVLDLCAGSAAIACALGAERPGWRIWAVERDPVALGYAEVNVRRLGLRDRVTLLRGDLFEPLAGVAPAGAVDLIVSNPPYLATPSLAALPVEVREWEPRAALDGGPDGLAVIRRLVEAAPRWLRPGGWLLAETGEEHGSALRALVGADARYGAVQVTRDFAGRERMLEARRR